jgi:TrmH family RNA methyltransferase
MLTKNEIKHISSLSIKKYREIHNEFTAEGAKVVAELLNSNYNVHKVYCIEEWFRKNDFILSSGNYEFEVISEKELERISSLSTPNQVIAVAAIPENTPQLFDPEKELILALDDIKDPGNLGTIIRTADWFGIKKIICSENTVDVYNTKVIQAAMGSSFRVELLYIDLSEYFKKLNKKINIYGALLDGEILYDKKLNNSGIIVIGNESKGISDEIKPFITDKLFIPQFNTSSSSDKPESLNASIATAVICYEFCRQNQNK